jgi:Zn-dependent protease
MNSRISPFYWSFPCGTWFLTRVRVSVYFPLVVLLVCHQLEGLRLGLIFSGILFVSVLGHEFAHVVAARLTNGNGREILIWPLGGLAVVQPAPSFRSRFLTATAGPLFNLVVCGLTFLAVLHSGQATEILKPLRFPLAQLSDELLPNLYILTFWVNWILLLVNLIPVYPLDGGRMVQACLMPRLGSEMATDLCVRIGFLAGFIALFAGLFFGSVWIVALGAFVLLLNMQESQQIRSADGYEESFMGYDFSQGYTSLERSDDSQPQHQPGLLDRWRTKRREGRQRRSQEKRAQAERRLDELLEKVHVHGIGALSDAERRHLNRASARYRDRTKGDE